LNTPHHVGTLSTYDVLINDVPIHEAVQVHEEIDSLFVLPSTIDLSGAEIELVMIEGRESRLRAALTDYLRHRSRNGEPPTDYVFFDCPPSPGLLTINAYVAAQDVLIPIHPEYYALEVLSQLFSNIDLIRQHLNSALHVSPILLTMNDSRTNRSM